ncbi:hypothetical protein, partial [Vibrio vulnificus]|uniref:hypothetical protein n=1 Tax=Vibrio vulnificus TaxID=672 RepID=UPI003EDA58EA
FGHFKSPLGRRFDLIIRARRLECGVYDALTIGKCVWLAQRPSQLDKPQDEGSKHDEPLLMGASKMANVFGQKRVRYIALTRLTQIRKSNLKSQIFVKIGSPCIPFSFEFDKAFIIT